MATGFERRWKGKVAYDTNQLWIGKLNPIPDTAVVPAGSTRAGAYALSSVDNFIGGTVSAGTGVVLSANLQPGGRQRVWARTGTTAVKVYANDPITIDGTAGSTGVSLTAPKAVEFFCENSSTIVSAALGAVSS